MLEVLMIAMVILFAYKIGLQKRYTSDLRKTRMRRNHRQKGLRSNYQSTV
jgi:hypothetical protein